MHILFDNMPNDRLAFSFIKDGNLSEFCALTNGWRFP